MTALKWIQANILGLVVVFSVGIFASVLGNSYSQFSAPVIALLLGAAIANTGALGSWSQPAIKFVAGRLLKVGISLLGFRLAFSNIAEIGSPVGIFIIVIVVVLVFFGIRWLGSVLGVSKPLALLVSTGFSICGISAIAAMRPVSEADDEETGYAIGLVTLFGTLSLFLLPLFQIIFDIEATAFGWWVGLSVHDTGQVVATSSAISESALESAVVVKMCRILMLAPILMFVSSMKKVKSNNFQKRPPFIPIFILGFLGSSTIRSVEIFSEKMLENIGDIRGFFITTAMFGLGAGINIKTLKSLGGRPLLLGFISWIFIIVLAGLGVLLESQF